MRRLERCFCCDLKIGATILGWLELVLAIFTVIGILGDVISTAIYNQDHRYPITYSTIICISLLVNGILHIIVSGLLLWGLKKRKKNLLLPWLIWNMINNVVLTMGILILSIYFLIYIQVEYAYLLILSIIIGLAIGGFYSYFWACVLCLYKDFSDEEQVNTQKQPEEIGFIEYRPQT